MIKGSAVPNLKFYKLWLLKVPLFFSNKIQKWQEGWNLRELSRNNWKKAKKPKQAKKVKKAKKPAAKKAEKPKKAAKKPARNLINLVKSYEGCQIKQK